MLKHNIKQLLRSQRGAALIEFALILPIFLLLFVGGIEVSRVIAANQQVDKAGYQLTNLLTRVQTITRSQLDDQSDALPQMIDNWEDQRGVIIYTIITCNDDGDLTTNSNCDATGGGVPRVVDQYATGGTLGAGSEIGSPGGPADTFGLDLIEGDFIVVTETFLLYDSFFANLLGFLNLEFLNTSDPILKRIFMRPRSGRLTRID